jgi:hypothetical protein
MLHKIQNITKKDKWKSINGTRVVVAAFGIFAGITGIIAGVFEILQGDIPTEGIVISYIGYDYSIADDFTYFAVTIIPNFLVTGIFAVILSSLFLIWSVGFVHKPNGVKMLFLLAVLQMLVGGGWVIDLSLMTCILATRINQPLNWWRANLPSKLQKWLSNLLPISLICYSIIALSMNTISILAIYNEALLTIMTWLATLMFLPMILMIFGALAHDIQKDQISSRIFQR